MDTLPGGNLSRSSLNEIATKPARGNKGPGWFQSKSKDEKDDDDDEEANGDRKMTTPVRCSSWITTQGFLVFLNFSISQFATCVVSPLFFLALSNTLLMIIKEQTYDCLEDTEPLGQAQSQGLQRFFFCFWKQQCTEKSHNFIPNSLVLLFISAPDNKKKFPSLKKGFQVRHPQVQHSTCCLFFFFDSSRHCSCYTFNSKCFFPLQFLPEKGSALRTQELQKKCDKVNSRQQHQDEIVLYLEFNLTFTP